MSKQEIAKSVFNGVETMKDKIIKHYEKRINVWKEKLEMANQIVDSCECYDELFWEKQIRICNTSLKSLQEQLDYIKENLK